MKKSHILILGFLSLVLVITTGFTVNNSSALDIEEDIKVDNFTEVNISIPAKVSLELGNKHTLNIDASPAIMEKIEVKVENGALIIKKKDKKSRINGDINISITAPDIESVSVAGSGDVYSQKDFSVDELELKIAGSGNMKFAQLKADEIEIKIAGSGDLFLKGQGADELDISIAGSGNLDAVDFEVDQFSGKISGSGDCKVYVTGELNATIAGSGSVKYKGSPSVNTTVSGSGKVSTL